MGCTFLAAGRRDPGEALEGIEDGVYVRRMEAASTDARTGRATFRVTDADRIRHGRIVAPLAPHVILVDARAALSSIDCVASDLAFDTCIGSCLNHGQPLSISVGAPTFRIGSTSVMF
jgi:TldD protein